MRFRIVTILGLMLLLSVSVLGQGTVTGALTGTVTSEGVPLPGATVTVTSPNLQGTRTAVTDVNGNYNFVSLPPGDYTVNVALEGLAPVTHNTRISAAGTARVDASLSVAAVTEAITVTASAPAVIETTEVQANYQQDVINQLPVGRNPNAIANLAPGVTNNGPNNAVQISGAMSSDNLIMVNGAVVQDNIRGTTRPLFIEDAIQETTVMTAGVSAEYGNFTGGVINTVTRSGGNDLSGSLRDSLTNPSWTAVSDAGEAEGRDQINNTYEATLGGRILRDRLWFFGAARRANISNPATSPNLIGQSGTLIMSQQTNLRWEGKLTAAITPRHNLVVDYLDNPLEFTNNTQGRAYDLNAVDPSAKQLEDFRAVHYNGVFTNNLFGEVNYNQRHFAFVGFGGDNADPVAGTPLYVWRGAANPLHGTANAPLFCGTCDDETRDSEKLTAKMTWFLGTKALGTHNVVGGVERYTEELLSNNYQSASGFILYTFYEDPQFNANGTIFTLSPGDELASWRVENPSLGSDLTTDSIFINDKWDLNSRFSFNVGLRYDKTEAVDQAGNSTADEDSFSPRLSATYDPAGNGRLRFLASYGRYVGRLSESVQGASSNAGSPNFYGWYYDGAPFTGTAREVVAHAIAWWNARGGANEQLNPAEDVAIGGVSTRLQDGGVRAPSMYEYTLGTAFQYRPTGIVRGDVIYRDWRDFYTSFTNLGTGQTTLPSGNRADVTIVGNADQWKREYRALQVQFFDRFFNRLQVGGSYTLSKLEGNIEGETAGAGPVSTGGWIFTYPEFQGYDEAAATGYLAGDQRHKLRAWVGMDFPLGPAGTLNVSLLQRFDSGTPYSAIISVPAVASPSAPADIRSRYLGEPLTTTYYIGERGRFRWDDVTRTDFALNYRLPIRAIELFAEAEVFNLFDEQAQIGGQTTVFGPTSTTTACRDTAGNAVRCQAFDPWRQAPVEGVNYAYSPNFGKPTPGLAANYQLARTYQFSLGFRF